MTAHNLRFLPQCVTPNHKCIVVSAPGRQHSKDSKVTDLLLRHFKGDSAAWQAVEHKFLSLVQVNGINVDIEKLLFDARQRSLRFDQNYCLSLGEELSAKVAAQFLHLPYAEAQQLVRFDGAKLQLRRTLQNLKSAASNLGAFVMGGFYGGNNFGRSVFSRGGSDISGALCAAATCSVLYENFTDVCGVCTANPKFAEGVQTLPQLSYNQMYLLARNGAEVLHPDAVRVVQRSGTPLFVGHFQRGKGTMVSNCKGMQPFLSATQQLSGQGVVTTIVHNMPLPQVFRCLQQLPQGTTKWCKCAPSCVTICSSQSIVAQVHAAFVVANKDCG